MRSNTTSTTGRVALLAEGVDRNTRSSARVLTVAVALLAEGVDRNHFEDGMRGLDSLVALLAEGVDRNLKGVVLDTVFIRRPPRGGRG